MSDYTIIGQPYQGTHTLGDWQSDDAYDLGTPIGTPMLAAAAGIVSKLTPHAQDGSRFAGDAITITLDDGNQLFYKHGTASVTLGERVTAGEQIGTTGSANGSPHLHFGALRDPKKYLSAVLGNADGGLLDKAAGVATGVAGAITNPGAALGGAAVDGASSAAGAAGDAATATANALVGLVVGQLGEKGARIAVVIALVAGALVLIGLGAGRMLGLGAKAKTAGAMGVKAAELFATKGASGAAKTT